MAILIHECNDCGHAQKDHHRSARGYTDCRCCNVGASPPFNPTPTVRETWTLDGEPEPLYEPGTIRNPGGPHREPLCKCGACVTTFQQITKGTDQ